VGVKDYLRILLRHRFYVAGVFLVVLAAVTAWTFVQVPLYEAEGRLLFKRQDTTVTSGQSGGRGGFGQLDSIAFGNPLDTQAEIISSRPLAEAVIRRLDLRSPQRPEEPMDPQIFRKILKVETLRRTDLIQLKYRDTDPRRASRVLNELAKLYIDRNVLENRAEAASTREFVEKQLPVMEKRLRTAERELRLFKERYGSIALKEEEGAAVRILAEFKSQQAQANVVLAESEARAQGLASRVGLSENDAIVAAGLMRTDGIKDLRTQLLDVESKLAVLRTQYQDSYPEVEQLLRRRDALRRVLQSEVDRTFRRRLAQPSLVDSAVPGGELVDRQPRDNLPRLDAVRQELVRSFIEARVAEIAARTRLDALQSVAAAYSKRVADLPGLEERQRQLERSVEATQEAYQLLQRKYYEMRLLEAQNIGNAALLEPAVVPDDPVWPRKTLFLTLGAVVALVLGITVAFVREFLDESIRTVDEVREVLGSNSLGTVPTFNDRGDDLISRRDPLSPVSEAYRTIRTNIRFLSTEKPIKVIVLSSSVPQEGKSTTAVNLANVSAQSGARVLLIDADLRKPRQHRILNVPNLQGLSNALFADGGHWQQHMQPTEQDKLSVLTSGPLPPNPVALLESPRMTELVREVREQFDLVIIDAPPLTAATDATVLSALADGMLLIVRPGVANKRFLGKLRDTFKQSRVRLLGHVVNGVIPENEGYGYYYYYNRYSGDSAAMNGGSQRESARNGGAKAGWFRSADNTDKTKR
jgi:capsular exopolysaccharide synthesis family protein